MLTQQTVAIAESTRAFGLWMCN